MAQINFTFTQVAVAPGIALPPGMLATVRYDKDGDKVLDLWETTHSGVIGKTSGVQMTTNDFITALTIPDIGVDKIELYKAQCSIV